MEPLRCVALRPDPPEEDGSPVAFRWVPTLDAARAALLSEEADALAVDVAAMGEEGLEALSVLARTYPHLPVVAVAAPEQMPEAVRRGARGLLAPPATGRALAEEVLSAVRTHRAFREEAQLAVLRPLQQLRDLVPADGSPEGVLRRLVEIARHSLGAERAAVVTLSPQAQDLMVATVQRAGGSWAEQLWTFLPDRLTHAHLPAEDSQEVLTAALATADRTLGALTVFRTREPFGPVHRELLNLLGVLGALPLLQVDLVRRVQQANQSLVNALAYACELHEATLRGHSERLACYAVAVGRRLGFSEFALQELRVAGMLHDVGKIGISDAILLKPGPLTPEEFELVKRHTVMGAEILSAAGFGEDVVRWVLHHHERWDGRGYPMGLRGEEIPVGARVLAVVDAFEVMTAGRIYRPAVPVEAAVEELRAQRGRQFAPEVVDVFVEVLRSGEVHVELESGR
ncbi:MAG: HD domain-containing protein [Armatimonadota bacterium]|nr:HD domain-containing protein [Armatimonadota bacterium]MDR7444026.1 HD domain-containing protein [Armatimonadota bacterium]MDR7570294.1 HD domain-containing protein [Armatimonadota bacterium]MDR7613475.1 HD domain-containing protein [Armatimonadota bacterium]